MVEAECNAPGIHIRITGRNRIASRITKHITRRGPDRRKKEKVKRKSSIVVATARPEPKKVSESRLWHRRLAHLHPTAMRLLIDALTHEGMQCDVCTGPRRVPKQHISLALPTRAARMVLPNGSLSHHQKKARAMMCRPQRSSGVLKLS